MFECFFRKGSSKIENKTTSPISKTEKNTIEPENKPSNIEEAQVMKAVKFETFHPEDITVHELKDNDILEVETSVGSKYVFLVKRSPEKGAYLQCISGGKDSNNTEGVLMGSMIKPGKELRYGQYQTNAPTVSIVLQRPVKQ